MVDTCSWGFQYFGQEGSTVIVCSLNAVLAAGPCITFYPSKSIWISRTFGNTAFRNGATLVLTNRAHFSVDQELETKKATVKA